MLPFTTLYLALDATTKTSEKRALLADYFQRTPHADAAHALALFLGERPRRPVKRPTLLQALIRATDLPEWLVHECRESVGDFAETISLLTNPGPGSTEALHAVIETRINPLRDLDPESQITALHDTWRALDEEQILVFHKILGGGFRVGAQKRLVVRALADAFAIDLAIIEQRLAGGFTPTPGAFAALISPEGERDLAARPYPFFLAHQLEAPPETLGSPRDWIAEDKLDGVRAQFIRRAGATMLWSRGETRLNDQFPEIVAIGPQLPGDAVIDAELVIMRDDRPRPFSELQMRLQRKVAPTAQPGLFDRDEAALIAFDLLELDGRDLRALPLLERRERLAELVDRCAHTALRLSPRINADAWQDLAAIRAGARTRGSEGLMLKHAQSRYGSGRRKSHSPDDLGWWKWKLDPYTIDAVLVYAQPGSGRRSGLFTDYTFALWSAAPEDPSRELVPFAKAYSGLTHEEIQNIDRFVRTNTIERMGPVRRVTPAMVFELAFEGVARSDRRRAGVAVRFPRMLRQRTDKAPEEADTMALLEAIIRQREGQR